MQCMCTASGEHWDPPHCKPHCYYYHYLHHHVGATRATSPGASTRTRASAPRENACRGDGQQQQQEDLNLCVIIGTGAQARAPTAWRSGLTRLSTSQTTTINVPLLLLTDSVLARAFSSPAIPNPLGCMRANLLPLRRAEVLSTDSTPSGKRLSPAAPPLHGSVPCSLGGTARVHRSPTQNEQLFSDNSIEKASRMHMLPH